MCFNWKAFQSLRKFLKARTVILGDDTEVGAYGIGTVYLTEFMVLEDILYVPDFTINLVSVSKLTRTSHMVTFEKDECTIAKDGRIAIQGKGESCISLIKTLRITPSPISVSIIPCLRKNPFLSITVRERHMHRITHRRTGSRDSRVSLIRVGTKSAKRRSPGRSNSGLFRRIRF